jgi:hypothetical protein
MLTKNLRSEAKKRYKLIVFIKRSLCNVTVPDPYLIVHPITGVMDPDMTKL